MPLRSSFQPPDGTPGGVAYEQSKRMDAEEAEGAENNGLSAPSASSASAVVPVPVTGREKRLFLQVFPCTVGDSVVCL